MSWMHESSFTFAKRDYEVKVVAAFVRSNEVDTAVVCRAGKSLCVFTRIKEGEAEDWKAEGGEVQDGWVLAGGRKKIFQQAAKHLYQLKV